MATILVVDDRPVNRQYLMTLLGYTGHRMLEAGDGAEALEVVRAEHPDLVICDVVMPTMDGIEFVRRLRADSALGSTRVVFYTATYRAEVIEKMMQPYGALTVIPKPSDPEDILRIVNVELGVPATQSLPIPAFVTEQLDLERVALVNEKVSEYLSRLQELNLRLTQTIAGGRLLPEERDQFESLSRRLQDNLSAVQGISLRLTGLVEVQMDLSAQHDVPSVLEELCRSAQSILSAKYSAVGVVGADGQQLSHFLLRGADTEALRRMEQPAPLAGALGRVVSTRRPQRSSAPGDLRSLGLPRNHPPVESFLAVPLATRNKVYGWVYVANKMGAKQFNDEDARFGVTLASQAALVLENTQRSEEAKRLGERYQQLFENASDVVLTLDLEGVILNLNRAGERILGYTREEASGRNILDLLVPASRERALEMQQLKLQGEQQTTYEVELIAKDGHHVLLEISSRLQMEDGQPVGVFGIGRDVTQRKSLEDQLRQSQKMEAVGRLAGGVAHDFNNLLGVILGYGQLLQRRAQPGDPSHEKLGEIIKAAERAATLTRQLLAFSRKQVLRPVVVNLNQVVFDMDKMLRRLIGEDINLVTHLNGNTGQVLIDPGQLEQVIMNLAVNARDAMPQGGNLTIQTTNVDLDEGYAVKHPVVPPGRYVMLALSDTGVGMSNEVQAKAFEPFFTTKSEGKGTGLGLSTVYGIVKQSGGFIWMYSEQNQGATFKIYLPRVNAPPEPARVTIPIEETQGTETILLAEDEASLRGMATIFLEEAGYTVLGAGNGAEALARAMRHAGPIHLLVTDVIMPSMGGHLLAEALKKTHPQVKVLYVSGYTDETIVHHGILTPGVSFLEKPYSGPGLLRRIREILDARS